MLVTVGLHHLDRNIGGITKRSGAALAVVSAALATTRSVARAVVRTRAVALVRRDGFVDE
jgi:hypothetical protein